MNGGGYAQAPRNIWDSRVPLLRKLECRPPDINCAGVPRTEWIVCQIYFRHSGHGGGPYGDRSYSFFANETVRSAMVRARNVHLWL